MSRVDALLTVAYFVLLGMGLFTAVFTALLVQDWWHSYQFEKRTRSINAGWRKELERGGRR